MRAYGNILIVHSAAIRVEFLRSRARALRFAEEVQILLEEQRRVLQSLENDAKMWEHRAVLAMQKECLIIRQGAIAYSMRQAAIRRKLATAFRDAWSAGIVLNGKDTTDAPKKKQELFTIEEDSDEEMNLLKDYASDDE